MAQKNEPDEEWRFYGAAFDLSRSRTRQKRSQRLFYTVCVVQLGSIILLASLCYAAQGSDAVRLLDALANQIPQAIQTRLALVESRSLFGRYEYLAFLVTFVPFQIWGVVSLLRLYAEEAFADRNAHRLGLQHVVVAFVFLAVGCMLPYIMFVLELDLRSSSRAELMVNPVSFPPLFSGFSYFLSAAIVNLLALGIRLRNGFESWSSP